MAIIAIVSATALTILTTSFNNTRAAMFKADAQYIVYDALECFKATGSADEFHNAFKFRGNVEHEPDYKQPLGPGAPGVVLTYKISDSKYTVKVVLIYNTESPNSVLSADVFNISVYNTEDKEIASTNYRRIRDYHEEEGAQ